MSLGLTEFSILSCLKLIFFLIFIFLNIFLFYTESLDRKYKNINLESHLQSGLGPEFIKLSHRAVLVIGVLSSIITIKNEYNNHVNLAAKLAEKVAEVKSLEEKLVETAKQATNERTALNFIHKLHMTRIKNDVSILIQCEEERSEILERVKERNVE
jgi:hypothetical protein